MNIEQLKQALKFGIPFVVLDTETTGLKPGGIIEIAAQKFRGQDVVAEFHFIVNPECFIEQGASFTNGLTHKIVQEQGKAVSEIIPAFVNFCGTSTLVGHNIGFDLKFINHHLRNLNMAELKNPYVDTLELAKKYMSLGTSNNKLGTIASHFGIDISGAHRAMKDVDITRQVFVKMLNL
ncbi:MAG: polymerase III subunit epsilon, DNA polymerase III subunit epsilon protein [Candidatus Peregrinibacteria bacterium GW2011_GWF2_33_10]|nr:MAG: polymerase III subunit epsilon, DNA polymerase III subunit epsilon protein [Candidatus Peregrinibacteria bacterium GW2011_GWF2_33_10]OGJ44973.1 MAG: hypothetical protein A2263_02825 [Candidatus Peregrinibacteria bacterium RIFOXYA2_FULL_33_21]OGJ46365.1 MAG: hypothetical protein A2272_01110 [Candidatus Peregrinibacteria bacterium RIFOXYA12_FULL_33_12]OGJ50716.1 MAG: hypothetical protein A2307_03640 [Candidatus Peregrinibacteria bacterium RIFOXYB2_FULL_33_20]